MKREKCHIYQMQKNLRIKHTKNLWRNGIKGKQWKNKICTNSKRKNNRIGKEKNQKRKRSRKTPGSTRRSYRRQRSKMKKRKGIVEGSRKRRNGW